MADRKDQAPQTQDAPAVDRAAAQRMTAQKMVDPNEVQRAAEQMNTTVEGGRYVVNDRVVDANGNPLKDKD